MLACSNSGRSYKMDSAAPSESAHDMLYSTQPSTAAANGGSEALEEEVENVQQALDTKTADEAGAIKRKIIRNADMSYQVSKYDKIMPQIRTAVKRLGGRIAGENETNLGSRINNELLIRVNSDQFDVLLDSLMLFADNIEYKRINSNDITEQYSDLSARMKAKKELEGRYLALLKQAKTIKEILEVEAQMRVIREEIEVVEGRLRLYDSQVAESTINLTVYEQLSFAPQTKKGFVQRFFNAIGEGWESLLEFLIGMAQGWPFWLMLVGIVWLLRRWWNGRKKESQKPAMNPIAPTPNNSAQQGNNNNNTTPPATP